MASFCFTKIECACFSITGSFRRHNEDNILFFRRCLKEEHGDMQNVLYDSISSQNHAFFAVFDGMGGEQAGEKASYVAALKAHEYEDVNEWDEASLNDMIKKLNQEVCNERIKGRYSTIGTTVALMIYSDGELYSVNVGDSPVIMMRNDKAEVLSKPHSEEKRIFPNGNRQKVLTQFLGIDEEEFVIEPHISKKAVNKGDFFLACSDGLTDALNIEEIEDILSKNNSVVDAVRKLVETADKISGKDNITACLMQFS